MKSTLSRVTLFFIACHAAATVAHAQSAAGCEPNSLKAEQLYGLWAVQYSNPPPGLPASATMELRRHAEFAESLAGSVRRDVGAASGPTAITGLAARAALAGDLEDGFLLLDESSNNVNITGTWNGEMVRGSCGRMFTGTWKDTSSSAPADLPGIAFTLRKLP
jgi:hypothetical protein